MQSHCYTTNKNKIIIVFSLAVADNSHSYINHYTVTGFTKTIEADLGGASQSK